MNQTHKDQLENLIGTKFGRLTVVAIEPAIKSKIMVSCMCDCGTPKRVYLSHIRKGHTKSCGCLAKEVRMANKISNCYFF